MCIAILNTPEGGLISREVLQQCWDSNRDGAGFVFSMDGTLEVFKELKKFKRFYVAYELARVAYPQANFIIHFRIKTHGLVNKDNCHPFVIDETCAFAHNGMVEGFGVKEKSDTVDFMEKVLRKLPVGFLEMEGIRRLIRKSTGWSKFVFLNSDNTYRIINEEGGKWDEKNWYSNETYKKRGYVDYGGKSIQTRSYTGYQGSWMGGSGAFTKDGLPLETVSKKKDDDEDWIEKRYAAANYAEDVKAERDFIDSLDEAPAVTKSPSVRHCSECYSELDGKMENHYGCCTTCLVQYEVIPDPKKC